MIRFALLALVTLTATSTAAQDASSGNEFDLSEFGGIEESSGPNGQRVRREIGGEAEVQPPAPEAPREREYRVYRNDDAPSDPERSGLLQGCEQTDNGFRCIRSTGNSPEGESRARQRLEEILDDPAS